jgi:hypothetical protein
LLVVHAKSNNILWGKTLYKLNNQHFCLMTGLIKGLDSFAMI